MSYSIVAIAASKVAVLAIVGEKLSAVVEQQPVHAKDIDAAKQAAEAFVSFVEEPGEGKQLRVIVSGYLSWQYISPDNEPANFTGANVNVSVQTEAIPAEPAA